MNDFLKHKELYHYGVKGQKWGVRRYQDRDGTRLKTSGQQYSIDDVVFVSGKVKYDKELDEAVASELDNVMKSKSNIIVGDAPGSDKLVQDYLNEKGYRNVKVYTSDLNARNNSGMWQVIRIASNKQLDETKRRELKDIAMTNLATKAIAIMPEDDRSGSAMSNNISRLRDKNLEPVIFDYEKKKWVN